MLTLLFLDLQALVQTYNRDVVLFILVIIVIFGFSSMRNQSTDVLARQQTEEWKGWMQVNYAWSLCWPHGKIACHMMQLSNRAGVLQVLFLMYHYFHAVEMYNAIRVFISAYIWMTGYGNTLYYVEKADFSITRFVVHVFALACSVHILLTQSYAHAVENQFFGCVLLLIVEERLHGVLHLSVAYFIHMCSHSVPGHMFAT